MVRLWFASILVLSALATPASVHARSRWDFELGGGALVYAPTLPNIPRGSADTAVEPLVEASVGRILSDRLTARMSLGFAQQGSITWKSASGEGTAELPLPSMWSAFLSLETPLFRSRVIPSAAVGAGVIGFGHVEELVAFDWGSYQETNPYELASRTDPVLFFELGAHTALTEGLTVVLRYRLSSVFASGQVDTLDRFTISARLPF